MRAQSDLGQRLVGGRPARLFRGVGLRNQSLQMFFVFSQSRIIDLSPTQQPSEHADSAAHLAGDCSLYCFWRAMT